MALLLLPTGRLLGQDDPAAEVSLLHFAPWKVEFLNRHEKGAFCWLADEEGNLRAEILLGNGGLDQLLDWSGPDGWTVIDAVSGDGTMSRWYEEWRPVDPELRVWARFLPAVLVPGGRLGLPQGVRILRWGDPPVLSRGLQGRIPAVETYQVASREGKRGLRRRLPNRGLGRGGPEAVVRLWRASREGSPTTVTSSRYAGQLTIMPVESYRVGFDAAAFLPWWPLRDTLIFP